MKRKLIFVLQILLYAHFCYSQSDTIVVKNQKGVLFISNYNFQYDQSGGHWKPVGFHDYFFPCDYFDYRLLSDSNLTIIFKNGIRVDGFKERNMLKAKAKSFEGSDSSKCYLFPDESPPLCFCAAGRDSSALGLYLGGMSVHHPHIKEDGIYFITFTCHRWLKLVELSNGYNSLYKFFEVLKIKGHTICGYVIMPNHVHLLLHYSGGAQSLNTIIGNGKRFMAYEIVKGLKENRHANVLEQLQAGVQLKDRQRGKLHEVWIDSFDVKQCRTEKFILQKLNYMHLNPISGKWKLCATILAYLHSSAPFYFNGQQQLFELKDYRQFVKWETLYE